eukprot:3513318-Amphidinium_carterae.1
MHGPLSEERQPILHVRTGFRRTIAKTHRAWQRRQGRCKSGTQGQTGWEADTHAASRRWRAWALIMDKRRAGC